MPSDKKQDNFMDAILNMGDLCPEQKMAYAVLCNWIIEVKTVYFTDPGEDEIDKQVHHARLKELMNYPNTEDCQFWCRIAGVSEEHLQRVMNMVLTGKVAL